MNINLIMPKNCPHCREPIPRIKKDGTLKTEAEYDRSVFCCSSCATSFRYTDSYKKKHGIIKKEVAKKANQSFLALHKIAAKNLNAHDAWARGL